jgi:eukaryotic-like serine/threonine-protein kinase
VIGLARQAGDDLAPGTMVGEYQIEARIGAGGMGVVYGALHPVIGKRAAIKVLNAKYSNDREELERFVLEAQAVNKIGHENIVDIFAFGHLPDGRRYFAMEWLVGETLHARLTHTVLPLADTVAIVTSLCHALEAAHAAGILHRDLKPENVFLLRGDNARRIKLLDFGIAKLTGGDNANRTATGIVVGTPMYMSPEQASGAPLDAGTDIYTLGVVLYAMVCGKTPFQDLRTGVEIMTAHLRMPPPPPRSLNPTLPPELEQLLLKMLAKEPGQRPTLPEVRARLAALASFPGKPIAIAPPNAPTIVANVKASRVPTPGDPAGTAIVRRRSRAPAIAIGGVVLAVAIAAVAIVAAGNNDSPGPRETPEAPPPAPTTQGVSSTQLTPAKPPEPPAHEVAPGTPVKPAEPAVHDVEPAAPAKPPEPASHEVVHAAGSDATKPALPATHPTITRPTQSTAKHQEAKASEQAGSGSAIAPTVNTDRVHDPFHP